MNLKISASILGADFSALGKDIFRAERSGVDMLHIDVMDGQFVPNLSFGIPVVEAIRPQSRLFFDVHLMVQTPHTLVPAFAKAGADAITFHVESDSDVEQTIALIKSLDKRVGLSVRPNTPIEEIFEYLPLIDMVLIMSVEPGYGGQAFQPAMVQKIRTLREYATEHGLELDISVDGGINRTTAPLCTKAGANVIVMGTYLFGAEDMAKAVEGIRISS